MHGLKREAGGGYRCVASVPSVPGLNRTRLVHVAIFGESPSGRRAGGPLKLPGAGWFRALGGQKATCCPGRSGGGGEAGRGAGCHTALLPPEGPPWMTLKERKMWVRENAVLNLSCEASGHPRPTISWSVEGTVSRRLGPRSGTPAQAPLP